MGEKEETKNSIDVHNNKIKSTPKVFDPAISSFFVQLPHKVQNYLKAPLKGLTKDNERSSTMSSDPGEGKGSPTALEVDMERQLQHWRENPTWTDQPPVIKVRKS
ncbi:hypothetical protein CISIN_1g034097mg [Citrus sinensis]|uniref:Uncharacterized protein n=1 Tax=Citrus sinensis TaxID=2711 RepID=A0A067D5U0_CITSI|nr:hypothetical protein CISIN_1g034097mg [Citrus sinensis]KDO36898.1 hypothetical protein CISIN_1g034097mg [Citrus sinensis]KDO36899.1 hypothetical protein CISIN_1g034097mg [Citrus sinensis]KDO36900.1 hypothetical protein CISIN_1g034097mg [Citrus sinensis]